MSPRPEQLEAFLQLALAARGMTATGPPRAITGDASFRHFHRIATSAGTFVLVDAPPATENNAQYLLIATRWRARGLPLPEVLASDLAQGFFLVADFGERLLADVLRNEAPHHRYRQALDLLVRIQTLPDDGTCPPYDADRFRMELGIFDEWFLDRLLGCQLSAAETALLHEVQQSLLRVIARQRRVCVHRDYHSRNLLVLGDDTLGIVDFQDALFGPYSYDVVSLLRDCYVRWPDSDVIAWRDLYARLAAEHLPPDPGLSDLATDFDFTGMQRHLKAIGIFARLWVRNGRPAYLNDIPRVLGYLIEVGAAYPELATFAAWLHDEIVPRFAAVDARRKDGA